MSSPNQYENPIELPLGGHEVILNHRYEILSIVNDILLGIWFTIGSILFFFEPLTIAGTWLFLIGSVQMCIRPVIRLSRRMHLQRTGASQRPSPHSMDF